MKRTCDLLGCGNRIPVTAHGNRVYCCTLHGAQAWKLTPRFVVDVWLERERKQPAWMLFDRREYTCEDWRYSAEVLAELKKRLSNP